MTSRDYDDVPGTYVLDSRSYRKGYHLNMFCMSLNKAECREEFARDERAYLEKFPMTEEQRQAVLDRDYIGLLNLVPMSITHSRSSATTGSRHR